METKHPNGPGTGTRAPGRPLYVIVVVGLLMANVALWFAVSSARLALDQAGIAVVLSVGLVSADVHALMGPPDGTLNASEDFALPPYDGFERPSRPIEARCVAYARYGHMVYVFLDSSDQVTCVYYARRVRADATV